MLRIITYRHLIGSLGQMATFACSVAEVRGRAHGLVTSMPKHSIDVQKANREASRRGGLGAS